MHGCWKWIHKRTLRSTLVDTAHTYRGGEARQMVEVLGVVNKWGGGRFAPPRQPPPPHPLPPHSHVPPLTQAQYHALATNAQDQGCSRLRSACKQTSNTDYCNTPCSSSSSSSSSTFVPLQHAFPPPACATGMRIIACPMMAGGGGGKCQTIFQTWGRLKSGDTT